MRQQHETTCPAAPQLSAALAQLQSLLFHAREIEQDLTVLHRILQERRQLPASYTLVPSLQTNLAHLQHLLGHSGDLKLRSFTIIPWRRRAALAYIDGLSNEEIINEQIMNRLTDPPSPAPSPDALVATVINILPAAQVTATADMPQAIEHLMSGNALLLLEGTAAAVVIGATKLEARALEEPQNETTVRGPRDGFVEVLRTNISLLRRRNKDPNLIVQSHTVGVRSHTDVAVVYCRGVVDMRLVCEVERRLAAVKVDYISASGILEGIIEDHPYSPFPTTMSTERPDKVISAVKEGRVAIMLDGTPFVLLVPATVSSFFQSGDDYYNKWWSAAVIRFSRYVAGLISIVLPALYIALTNYNPAFLPTPLALSIAASRMGLPLPAFLEALFMEITLELMTEAGLRLPKNIGPAVSIVGGLVIGEAAVRAGFVSPIMIIIIAFTAIASFVIPNYQFSLTLRLLRVPMMVAAAVLGSFGVAVGLLAILVHLSILESFGEPYLAPLTPRSARSLSDLKDSLIVVPAFAKTNRPAYLEPEDVRRKKQY